MAATGPARSDIVAFLCPEATFTSQAAHRIAPNAPRQPVAPMREAVTAVRDGRVALGVVPIENSIEGSVNLTLDELAFGPDDVRICGEVTVPITMNLLGVRGTTLDAVKVVRSQP